jgi:hypothetical protein
MSGNGDVDDREQAIAIDKVRASKAGHAYHEAWAARSALELLLPSTDLVAITLEGFDVRDEADLAIGAVEIADLVRYRGQNDVARASRVEVVQFKYSIASADKPVRAADLAQTLTKFGLTDAELRAQHGDGRVAHVVRYEYATNRPIHLNLTAAIAATIQGVQGTEDIARQQEQIAEALKMSKALEATTEILGIGGDEKQRQIVARFIIRTAKEDGSLGAAALRDRVLATLGGIEYCDIPANPQPSLIPSGIAE